MTQWMVVMHIILQMRVFLFSNSLQNVLNVDSRYFKIILSELNMHLKHSLIRIFKNLNIYEKLHRYFKRKLNNKIL